MIKKLKEEKYDLITIIAILLFIMVICGIFGFVYETLYFFIKEGHFVRRGTAYGPWIPIYAYGSILNLLLLYKYRDNKLLMFVLSSLLSGFVELSVGFFLDKFDHKRLWNYKNQFLNINGYTSLKAMILFGIGVMFLVYILVPLVLKLVRKINRRLFYLISYLPGIIFLIDYIISNIIK